MKGTLSISPIKTEVFHLGENLETFLEKNLQEITLQEKDIFAITSKVVSLAENRIISKSQVGKDELVKRESDAYLGEIGFGCHLTIKEGLLIPSAGIDESNAADDFYILYPQDPFASAERIWKFLKKKFNLNQLGVLLTDSHTTPLRRGVTGISLSHWGIQGVRNMIGQEDLFGRPLKMTQINTVDALSTAAVYCMGEANECTPLAVIRGAEVEFTSISSASEVRMPLENDLYQPFLQKWNTEVLADQKSAAYT